RAAQPAEQRVHALVEDEEGGVLAALRSLGAEQRRERRLPCSGRAGNEGAGSALEATAHQSVQTFQSALQPLTVRFGPVLRGDQAWEHVEPTTLDRVVMKTAPERATAILRHTETAPQVAERGHAVFEKQRAMRDAQHLQVVFGSRQVVEQKHGAVLAREVLLQREDLPAIPERVTREQSQFRE